MFSLCKHTKHDCWFKKWIQSMNLWQQLLWSSESIKLRMIKSKHQKKLLKLIKVHNKPKKDKRIAQVNYHDNCNNASVIMGEALILMIFHTKPHDIWYINSEVVIHIFHEWLFFQVITQNVFHPDSWKIESIKDKHSETVIFIQHCTNWKRDLYLKM